MLRIRKKDKGAFAEAELRAFDAHVAAILKKNYPKAPETQDEDTLRTFVAAHRPKVMEWGLLKERDVAHGIHIAFAVTTDLGLDLEQTPWVREATQDKSLTAEGKLHRLYVGLYEAYEAQEEARNGTGARSADVALRADLHHGKTSVS